MSKSNPEGFKFHITIEDLRSKEPCYDPAVVLGEGWNGTLLDILTNDKVKDEDKVWAISWFLDDKTARRFSLNCARSALEALPEEVVTKEWKENLAKQLITVELFIEGKASNEERSAAWSVAWSAAGDAARSAAWSVAWSAAWSVAWSAAGSTAGDAARNAAGDAARSAAGSAVGNDTDSDTNSATYSAARSAQVQYLIKLIKELV